MGDLARSTEERGGDRPRSPRPPPPALLGDRPMSGVARTGDRPISPRSGDLGKGEMNHEILVFVV